MSCHSYVFFERVGEKFYLLMRAGKEILGCHGQIRCCLFIEERGDIVERMKNGKRFVRYKEGAEMYSMCQSKFEQMAKDAKAIYKVDKLVLVNCDIFEQYLETFRLYV